MPVSALVIGDPHFKVSNVKETAAMDDAIVNVALEKNPDIIVVLGDILDRHETIHVSPLTRATKFLSRLMGIAPTYVLIGNHDLKNNRQFLSDEHPFNGLKYCGDRITIVDTTLTTTINNLLFTFVPYVPPGRFVEALNYQPQWPNSTCIFGHQEFKGVKMGPIESIEGDEWDPENPFTVLGHVHNYQELQDNVVYTGTPIQHAFGDNHDKTISYFVFTSPTTRTHERIDLGLPRKYIARINCEDVSDFVPVANGELKIIIKGTTGEIRAVMKHPNIALWKKTGYKITYKDIPTCPGNGSFVNNHTPQKFSTVLYNKISNDSKLINAFETIFGKLELS